MWKKKKKNPGSLNPKQLFYGHCSLQRFQPLLRPVAKFSFKSKELRVFFLYEGKGTQFEEWCFLFLQHLKKWLRQWAKNGSHFVFLGLKARFPLFSFFFPRLQSLNFSAHPQLSTLHLPNPVCYLDINAKKCTKDHIFELRKKIRRLMIDHRSYVHNLSSCAIKAWKKFRLERNLNTWPLRYRCSALPTELSRYKRNPFLSFFET